MITDRYYYSRLTEKEKYVYTRLYKGVVALEKNIFIPIHVEQESIQRIYQAITDDNPYLYYFNQSVLNTAVSDQAMILMPQYFCTAEQIATYNGRLNQIINQMIADLDLLRVDEDLREKRIHDYFCENIVYDEQGTKQETAFGRLVAAHSIIGVFARKRGVCEGIAKATKLLFNAVDMGCIVVPGKSKDDEHAWNIVKVNGDAYHLDMTWDVANSRPGHICYDYYNLPEKEISLDHSEFGGVPVCTSWKENYFYKNGLLFENQKKLERYLDRAVDNGNRDIYFRLRKTFAGSTQIAALEAQKYVQKRISEKSDVRWTVSCVFNEEQKTGRIGIKC